LTEILDIYDENLNHIGTKARTLVHQDGDWHRVFHCWVIYRDKLGVDYLVMQRRASEKRIYPNLLDVTAAGHYEAGETIADGVREIQEELGLAVDFTDLIPLGKRVYAARIGLLLDYQISDVFFLINDQSLEQYVLQPTEVAEVVAFKVDDGLDFCSGNIEQIKAQVFGGLNTTVMLQQVDFIPNIDAYLYKILILAKRCLNGETHLVI